MKYGAFILSIGTILSYVFGVFRDILFSQYYGASGLTDIYFSAFLISDIVLMICVASALLGSLTPLYAREKNINQERGLKTFGMFFTYIPGFFLLVSIVGILLAPTIIPLILPKHFALYPAELIQLSQLFFISNGFFAFSNVLGNFLMSEKRFISTAIAPLLYNVGIIGGIIMGAENFGIIAAGIGGVIGSMMHLGIRVIEYFLQPTRFCFPVFTPSPVLAELFMSMSQRWLTVAIFPFMLLGLSRFAGSQNEGLYTLFLYSRNIISAPVAIFGVAFATAAFSSFSDFFEKKQYKNLSESFFNTLKKVLFWTIPTGIGVFFVGTEFLEYLYKLGKTSDEHQILSTLVMMLAIAIPFESINNVLCRMLNALHMGKVLIFSNIIFFISVFAILWGVFFITKNPSLAMSMGYSGAFIIQVCFIWYFLRTSTNIPLQKDKNEIDTIWTASLWANVAMIGVLILWEYTSLTPLLWIAAVMSGTMIFTVVLQKKTNLSLPYIVKKMM